MRQRRDGGNQRRNNKQCRERPRRRAAEQRDELAALHVWMAPAWQEITSRAAQKSLAVMCPACSRSPDGLLALMESANRGLIIRAGSMSLGFGIDIKKRTGRCADAAPAAGEKRGVPRGARFFTKGVRTSSPTGLAPLPALNPAC